MLASGLVHPDIPEKRREEQAVNTGQLVHGGSRMRKVFSSVVYGARSYIFLNTPTYRSQNAACCSRMYPQADLDKLLPPPCLLSSILIPLHSFCGVVGVRPSLCLP